MKKIVLSASLVLFAAAGTLGDNLNSTTPHNRRPGLDFGGAQAGLQLAYVTGLGGNPWGLSDPQDGMNACFGQGTYDQYAFETVNPATLFAADRDFVYMEGGDFNADVMENFLTANAGTIDAWVNAGGRLLMNSAPNVGNGMSFGFGVTLNYQQLSTTSTAADINHPVYQGPFLPVQSNMTGNYFSHAYVTGAGLSAITLNAFNNMVVAEQTVGAGHIVVGGVTLPFWWDPDPQSFNLYNNIICYAARIPAPGAGAVLAFGLVAAGRRRR